MARKAHGYDDLEAMRKDIEKLGEAMRVSPARPSAPGKAPAGRGGKPAPESPLLRALARKKASKAGKSGNHA